MLFTKSNTKKADPNIEMRSSISDAINLALRNGVWPAIIIDHLENCLIGLRQRELYRQNAVHSDPVTSNTAARAEEKRRAEALRAEQEAYAAAVNERGRRDAINNGKVA
jgi:hypothetical protein